MNSEMQSNKKVDPIVKAATKKRKRRKSILGQLFAFFIVFLALYLLFTLLIVGSVWYSFNSTAENTEIYSLKLVYDETTLHKMDAETANNEYGLYVPFTYLSEIGSFGIAGDGETVTLYLIGTENRIECTKNSSLVVINDNPIRIASPILYEEGEYLIPVLLIENYINGIDVVYNNEEMICSIVADAGKSDIELKLLLPEDMDNAYFPDEYKYYGDPNAPAE